MATGDRLNPLPNDSYTNREVDDETVVNGHRLAREVVRLAAGAALIGTVAIDQTTPGTTNGVVVNSATPGTGATNLGKAEDAAHTSGDVGVMALAVRNDSNAAFSGTDGDYTPIRVDSAGNVGTKDQGPGWTSAHGISGVPFTSADATSVASVTDTPGVGVKLVVTDLIVSVDTAMNVTFKCETSGAVIAGPFYLAANSSAQFTPRSKAWKLATTNKKLQVIASVPGNIMVDAHYYAET